MSSTRAPASLEIRPYLDSDESEVLDLLRTALGSGPAGDRSPQFFQWKHFANPFGPSYMLVAESEGRIVGLRAFMRWRFRAGDRVLEAVRAVDTATHPDYRGRGVFSKLTLAALDHIRNEVDLVFNTPNDKSLSGYLKMGWRVVGKVPVSVRFRRPLRVARAWRALDDAASSPGASPPVEAPKALEALRDAEGLSLLLEESVPRDGRLRTLRSLDYMFWRYGASPLGYRAITQERSGRVAGLALFRVRSRGMLWESTVAEVLVRPGDAPTARRLFRRLTRSAGVDHVTCSLPRGSTAGWAMKASGFMRAPDGVTLVVNPLRLDPAAGAADLRSWALSLGDVEVF